jgi:hypothetical protein
VLLGEERSGLLQTFTLLSLDPVSPNYNAVRLVRFPRRGWWRVVHPLPHWWVIYLVHRRPVNSRWYRRRSRPRLDPRTRRSRWYWRPVMRRPRGRRLRVRHLVPVVHLGSLLLGLWRLRLGSRGRRWCCSRPGMRSRIGLLLKTAAFGGRRTTCGRSRHCWQRPRCGDGKATCCRGRAVSAHCAPGHLCSFSNNGKRRSRDE